MGEESSQGITRRDLLRRGAVLGGAVVWTTPVVQTLGMGRAFASSASPVGAGISYIALVIECDNDGVKRLVKWEVDEGAWDDGSQTPFCTTPAHDSTGFGPHDAWAAPQKVNDRCFKVTVPDGCTILDGVVMGGGPSPDGFCEDVSPSAGPVVNVGPGC